MEIELSNFAKILSETPTSENTLLVDISDKDFILKK